MRPPTRLRNVGLSVLDRSPPAHDFETCEAVPVFREEALAETSSSSSSLKSVTLTATSGSSCSRPRSASEAERARMCLRLREDPRFSALKQTHLIPPSASAKHRASIRRGVMSAAWLASTHRTWRTQPETRSKGGPCSAGNGGHGLHMLGPTNHATKRAQWLQTPTNRISNSTLDSSGCILCFPLPPTLHAQRRALHYLNNAAAARQC